MRLALPGERVLTPGIPALKTTAVESTAPLVARTEPVAAPTCEACPTMAGCEPDPGRAFVTPGFITGTSVAAALTSGLAAHAELFRLRNEGRGISQRALARALYISATDLPDAYDPIVMRTGTRHSRRPTMGGLWRVVKDTGRIDCLTDEPNRNDSIDLLEPVVPPGMECFDPVQCDPGEPAFGQPQTTGACGRMPDRAPVSESYVPESHVCPPVPSAPFSVPPQISRFALGELGPQPPVYGCTDCRFDVTLDPGSAKLKGTLSGVLRAGIPSSPPRLVFLVQSKSGWTITGAPAAIPLMSTTPSWPVGYQYSLPVTTTQLGSVTTTMLPSLKVEVWMGLKGLTDALDRSEATVKGP